MKTCTQCKEVKDLVEFSKDTSTKDGLRYNCRPCENAYAKALYEANPEKHNARSKAWQKANPEKANANSRAWVKANPEKHNARSKAWQKANPDKVKDSHLMRKFGITLIQYNEMLKNQKCLCAICEKPEVIRSGKSNKIPDLCVDHDHDTGKVRGLLCTTCNKAIGLLKDSKHLLQKSIEYLEKTC